MYFFVQFQNLTVASAPDCRLSANEKTDSIYNSTMYDTGNNNQYARKIFDKKD